MVEVILAGAVPGRSRALASLRRWRDREGLPLPDRGLEVLARQVRLLDEGLGPVELFEAVLELLVLDPFPMICLPESRGGPDPYADGPAYVADPREAGRNLLADCDDTGWRRVQRAARRALDGLAARRRG